LSLFTHAVNSKSYTVSAMLRATSAPYLGQKQLKFIPACKMPPKLTLFSLVFTHVCSVAFQQPQETGPWNI